MGTLLNVMIYLAILCVAAVGLMTPIAIKHIHREKALKDKRTDQKVDKIIRQLMVMGGYYRSNNMTMDQSMTHFKLMGNYDDMKNKIKNVNK